jgi:queuine tRNA-ribosyltransferase
MDAFFATIRSLLEGSDTPPSTHERFVSTTDAFSAAYDGKLRVFAEAKRDWADVEYARGKGRLAREKAKTAVSEIVLNTTSPAGK